MKGEFPADSMSRQVLPYPQILHRQLGGVIGFQSHAYPHRLTASASLQVLHTPVVTVGTNAWPTLLAIPKDESAVLKGCVRKPG